MMDTQEMELIAETLFLMGTAIAEEISQTEEEKRRIAVKLHDPLCRLMEAKEKRKAEEAQDEYDECYRCTIGDYRKKFGGNK